MSSSSRLTRAVIQTSLGLCCALSAVQSAHAVLGGSPMTPPADATVSGIAWRGPQMPDLSELLGGYFPQYTDGVKAARAAHGRRGVAAVDQDTLVVRSGGHMGAFAGQAWLPQALPAGVSGQDIQ